MLRKLQSDLWIAVSMHQCIRHDFERTGETEPAVSEMAVLSQRDVSECLSFKALLTFIPKVASCSMALSIDVQNMAQSLYPPPQSRWSEL